MRAPFVEFASFQRLKVAFFPVFFNRKSQQEHIQLASVQGTQQSL